MHIFPSRIIDPKECICHPPRRISNLKQCRLLNHKNADGNIATNQTIVKHLKKEYVDYIYLFIMWIIINKLETWKEQRLSLTKHMYSISFLSHIHTLSCSIWDLSIRFQDISFIFGTRAETFVFLLLFPLCCVLVLFCPFQVI